MHAKENILKLCRKPWTGQMTDFKKNHFGGPWPILREPRKVSSILSLSVVWSDSPQGDSYWRNIYCNLKLRGE